jgi:hypothetical protein
MDSNQFFKNKIKNIKLEQDIFKTITKWQNKIYSLKNVNFELLEIKELSKKEILTNFDININNNIDNLKFYQLKTCEVGNSKFYLTLILQNNLIHQIIY